MTLRSLRTVAVLGLLAACSRRVQAQAPAGSILHFEIENATVYFFDCPYSQLAQNTNRLDRVANAAPAFQTGLGVGDIVSVNGGPVKGTSYESFIGLTSSPLGPGR